MSFIQSIDWMQILKCFVVGGAICIIGQILLDKTKLTPAKILVIFVTTGAILGGLGVYKCLIDFAGAGATVPLTGFGANLAKGSIEAVKESGLLGAFTGGVKASAGGIAAAIFFGYIASLIAKPKSNKNNNGSLQKKLSLFLTLNKNSESFMSKFEVRFSLKNCTI